MPSFTSGEVSIHYEEFGSGYPVLLFAPGGFQSSIDLWRRQAIDAIGVLEGSFRAIAFDQRNAGQSRAPIRPADGWADYARDAIGLMDHLGLERLHVWGQCIGPSFIMKAIELLGPEAPRRITAFVDHQPIGLTATNRGHFMHSLYRWAEGLPEGTLAGPAGMDPTMAAFCETMYGGDFVFSVSRDVVRGIDVPMLVLPGSDLAHPEEVALETARLARRAEVRLGWQEDLKATEEAILAFLRAHTPAT
jgi:pimeloyl-ACP methyl ester carboxylesterase